MSAVYYTSIVHIAEVARQHEMDKQLVLSISATRHSYQNISGQTQGLLLKSYNAIGPEYMLRAVAEFTLSSATVQH